MVTKYPHVQKAFADVELLKWSRIPVQGVEHKHSFVRDGEEKRTTSVEVSLEPDYTAAFDISYVGRWDPRKG
jgi:urate oxidase